MPKTEPKSEMGKRIVARMAALGLNAKQLSLSAGLNETYVRDLLKTEKPNPRYFHLKALAAQLGVTVAWLDNGDEGGAEVIEFWERKLDFEDQGKADAYSRMIASRDDSA